MDVKKKSESELKTHRCCFTGHRPHKLQLSEKVTKELLIQAIDQAIKDGYITFITGMAMGVDMWASEIVLDKRKENKDIHLIVALPHPDFEKNRNEWEKIKYQNIIRQADLVKVISEYPYKACYQKRNIYMVNHCNRVIAAYTGAPGGTKNTIDYAKRCGVQVVNIFD